jgi:hypothetical protein
LEIPSHGIGSFHHSFRDIDEIGDLPRIGFSHMAAAYMAMKHFNERNPAIVKELKTDPKLHLDACPVRFDMNRSRFFNDATYTHEAATLLLQAEYEQTQKDMQTSTNATLLPNSLSVPCAIVGPYNDIPGLELSAIAASQRFPVTSHRSFNLRMTSAYTSPYTQTVYPEMTESAVPVISNLLMQGRSDFVAVVYPFSDTGVSQIKVAFLLGGRLAHSVSLHDIASLSVCRHNAGRYCSWRWTKRACETRRLRTIPSFCKS